MFEITLYLLFIIVQAVIFYKAPVNKRINLSFACFIFFQLFIIAGFRHPDILNDTQAYIDNFNAIDTSKSFWYLEGRFEPAFQFFMKFISYYISKNPLALLIISSFITQGLIVLFLYKNSSLLWLSFFLYITFRLFFFSTSGLRQGLAVAICLFAYQYLKGNKAIYFFLLVIVATLFHYSAMIFIFLYFVKRLDINVKTFLITGLAVSVLLVFISLLADMFFTSFTYGKDYYDRGIELDSNLGTMLITANMLIVFSFVYYFWYRNLNEVSNEDRILIWSVFIAVIILIISIKFGILLRFTYYFTPFSLILLPKAICAINDRIVKSLSLRFWVVFSAVQFLIILYYRPEWYNFYPYKFYWE